MFSGKKILSAIRMSAMNFLARREHSIAELRRKLLVKFNTQRTSERFLEKNVLENSDESEQLIEQSIESIIEDAIEQVLQQLIADNLLNEQRFTESFIRSRINQGKGSVKIRLDLYERGISADLIDDFLDESFQFWQDYILAAKEKRFGLAKPKDYKEQCKQSRFLQQRGFIGDHIRRIFDNID